jgi:hypothetical protein
LGSIFALYQDILPLNHFYKNVYHLELRNIDFMKNPEVFVLALISILALLVAGCIGSQATQSNPAAATPSIASTAAITIAPTTTTYARPTICSTQAPGVVECLYTDLTPVTTAVPTKMKTTSPLVEEITGTGNSGGASPVEEISGPLAAPVTLTGLGNQIVWFEAVRPGVVTFKMRNGFGSQVIKNCEEKYFRVALAGKSIDSVLYDKGMALTGVTRTATIPLAGRYSLTVKSCGQWEITVS